MNEPIAVASELRSLYLKYLESSQPLRHAGLSGERAKLLGSEGILYRDPLVEPVARYPEAGMLAEACRDLNLSTQFADFAAKGAFSPNINLYVHQKST